MQILRDASKNSFRKTKRHEGCYTKTKWKEKFLQLY